MSKRRTVYTTEEEFFRLMDAYEYFFSRGVLDNDDEDTLLARQIVGRIGEYLQKIHIKMPEEM